MSTFWKKLLISILGLVIISIFVCRVFEETDKEGMTPFPFSLTEAARSTASDIASKVWQLVTSAKDALTAAGASAQRKTIAVGQSIQDKAIAAKQSIQAKAIAAKHSIQAKAIAAKSSIQRNFYLPQVLDKELVYLQNKVC